MVKSSMLVDKFRVVGIMVGDKLGKIILTLAMLCGCTPDLKPVWNIVELHSNDQSENIFIKVQGNGIGSPERIVIVSRDSQKRIDKDRDIIFSSRQPIFYKQNIDTISVYTDTKASSGSSLSGKIQLQQVILTNPELMDMCDTYKSAGITIIR